MDAGWNGCDSRVGQQREGPQERLTLPQTWGNSKLVLPGTGSQPAVTRPIAPFLRLGILESLRNIAGFDQHLKNLQLV
jgi:hypothetical protein